MRNRLNKDLFLIPFYLMIFIGSTISWAQWNPNPDCDVQAIRNAFISAGCVELDVCHDDCGMYFYNPTLMGAQNARNWAVSKGGDLASIPNAVTNQCLKDELNALGITSRIWLGGLKNTDGTYYWHNKQTFNYTNWKTGFPDGSGNPNYIYFEAGNGQWGNSHQGVERAFLIRVDICPKMDLLPRGFCVGQGGKIQVIPSFGQTPYTVTWDHTSSQDYVQQVAPTVPTNYPVHLVDRWGCTADSVVFVWVGENLDITVNIVDADCGESNGEIHIVTNDFTPSSLDNMRYSIDAGVTWQNNNPHFTGLATGTYWVWARINGCPTTKVKVNVNVDGAPDPDFSYTNTCLEEELIPTNIESAGGNFSFTTSPSDGASINPSTGQITNATPGTTYDINYTVGDAQCPSIATESVTYYTSPTPSTVITNTTCNNDNGKLNITATGGVSGYTYSINNGANFQSSGSFTDLATGSYNIVVKDNNGCEGSTTATVNASTPPTIELISQQNVSCNGGNNGSIQIQVNDGNPDFSYEWTPSSAGTEATIDNLTAGSYSVIVTDSDNCSTATSFLITQPSAISVSNITSTPTTCDNENGTATVIASGGTGTLSYSWSPGGADGPVASDLDDGNYTVTISDENGCSITDNVTVNAITPPTLSEVEASHEDVSIFGGSDGSATVFVAGGTPSYTYSWSPSGGDGVTATGLEAGTYTVTVQDASGCTDEITIIIEEPEDFNFEVTHTDSHCDLEDGTATVNFTAGDSDMDNYTFSWTPSGGSNSSATGLAPGTYTITITHISGSIKEQTFDIEVTPGPTITVDNTQDISCNGENDGTASISATGGTITSGYTYEWSPSGDNTASVSNLTPGNHTVSVTDNVGCITTETITINEPSVLEIAITATQDATCDTDNGAAVVEATGGTPDYSYSWAPSGGTDASASGLAPGTYTVTVTDNNNCTENISIVINPVTPPSMDASNITVQNVSCFNGSDGEVTVSANNGDGNYTFTWPDGSTGTNKTGLTAGTYNVTVEDGDGCTADFDVVITEPEEIAISIDSSTDATCDTDNGEATVSATGGTGEYSYSWSPSGGTDATATGLSPNDYTVTVTDENGCSMNIDVTINAVIPPSIDADDVTIQNVSCFGETDGQATVAASGGDGEYVYTWPDGATGATHTNLSAGTYNVTVEDGDGCTNDFDVIITEPDVLTLNVSSSQDATCDTDNGTATVEAGGGTPDYSYSWSPSGGTDASASGLAPGTYTVTVTDNNNCTENISIVINPVTPPSMDASNVTVQNVSCFNGSDGEATVSASNGDGNYTFTWSNGSTGTNKTGLTAGTYNVTVEDGDGCTADFDVVITEPEELEATVTATDTHCDLEDGTASVTVSGGTIGTGYTFSWSSNPSTTNSASGLQAGSHSVTVTDANGCSVTEFFTIEIDEGPTITVDDVTAISCNGNNDGSAQVSVSNGTAPYLYEWSNGEISNAINNLAAGDYTVSVKDALGCIVEQTITIVEPSEMNLTISGVDATCGIDNGTASVIATGGNAGYSYSWSPMGGSNSSASNLPANDYSVIVTDVKGCQKTAFITINTITPPTVTLVNSQDVNCNGETTGEITVSVSDGTTPYSYSWSPSGSSGPIASGLTAGTYTVTIEDASGCTDVISATITEPTAITLTTTSTLSQCGIPTGTASVTAQGGTGGYTYLWSPSGQTTATATELAAGLHTAIVTDQSGCTVAQTIEVENVTGPTLSLDVINNVSCLGENDGSVTVSATGGMGAYTYTWIPTGGNSPTATDLAPGDYIVTVTDENGCSDTESFSIVQPNALSVNLSATPTDCGLYTGSIYSTVTGGTPSYSYSWSNGMAGPNLIDVGSGEYEVMVKDAHGCQATTSIIVTAIGTLSVEAFPSDTTINIHESVGLEVVLDSGAVNPTYSWTPVTGLDCSDCNNPMVTPPDPAYYIVEVTTEDGCYGIDSVYIDVIYPCDQIFLPSIFSPNKDGVNDEFCVLGAYYQCFEEFRFTIYDRWGEEVFLTEDVDECWDGMYNNKNLNSSVYVWKIVAKTIYDKELKRTGSVTLVK